MLALLIRLTSIHQVLYYWYSMQLTNYELKLLKSWEEVYKKGQLSLWVMLALKDGPKHMAAIQELISACAGESLQANDQSIYRALRRYYDLDIIKYRNEPGNSGPDRKIYFLSEVGNHILQEFLIRNVIEVFYKPRVKELIMEGINDV